MNGTSFPFDTPPMRGAIAAGHPLTAEAGARVLAGGGNAVDACVAAGFASWVAESPLTGPGAGGFMLVHTPRTTRLLDFFVSVPLGEATAEMDQVWVDFSGGALQLFLCGAASCAVPGAVAGLEEAHRRYGRLPWRELTRHAVELARDGVEITAGQAYLHEILDGMLRLTPEARAVYGEERALREGELLLQPDLARTIERIGEEGAACLHGGELGAATAAHVQAGGGALSLEDLAAYRPVWRRPVRVPFAGAEFVSNPPPSSGGILIALGLLVLERTGLGGPPGSAEALARLAAVMQEQQRARDEDFARDLYRGGLVRRLLESKTGTTHISAVDGAGNAASLSCSTGAGSGVVVPGTGIHLNNMLGEYPVEATGVALKAGRRMTSLMSPSLALAGGVPRLVVGSAGSLRLRGAVMQVVINVLGHGLGVEEAISRARVHVDEEGAFHCEGGHDERELDRLEGMGHELVRWGGRNLFFGGAAAVETLPDGSLAAAGDPRRGGHGIVVE